MATLTVEQSQQLLAAAGTLLYIPILLALATGARRGEVLALRWKNTDLDRAIVDVVESVEQTKGNLRIKPPKSDSMRSITLPSFAISELRRQKKQQAEDLLRLGVRQSDDTMVCARANGETLTPKALTLAFSRRVRSIDGFPPIHFHSLRHTHATQLLSNGVHPRVAQERLWHANVALTLNIYSHVTATMQEDAASKIDATFRQKP
jgi:integrase